jgi:hypothetical protein
MQSTEKGMYDVVGISCSFIHQIQDRICGRLRSNTQRLQIIYTAMEGIRRKQTGMIDKFVEYENRLPMKMENPQE